MLGAGFVQGRTMSSSAPTKPAEPPAGATANPAVMMLMHSTAYDHLPANCSVCRAFDSWLEAMGGAVPINSVEDLMRESEGLEDK